MNRTGGIAGWARRMMNPGGLILLYQRVAKLDNDPMGTAVGPRHFAEHMEVIWKDYCLLSLRQMTAKAHIKMLPPKAVAITFDDGYCDNVLETRPLLEKHDAPATFFLVSGSIERLTDYWWDELEAFLLGPHKLPSTLSLMFKNRRQSWNLGESGAHPPRVSGHWDVTMSRAPSARHRVYREVAGLMKNLKENDRELVLSELADWSRQGRQRRQSHRSLSVREIAWLAKCDLVEIGCHSITHPVLSQIPAKAQEEEISLSKSAIEGIIEQPVTSFAYPFGLESDFNQRTVDLVRREGFERACGRFAGLVRPETDPLQLPRVVVRDCDGDEFARRMRRWLPR